jgi:uncharacterized protein involved in outer membrane biogenesis
MKSKKGLRILIGVVAAIIVLVVLASVVVKIVFTKEKLLSMLVPKIEAALDRKVEIQDVTVSIWGGLGADVKGMKVLNRPGFAREELFSFEQLSIRVKFWPLLRRRIEVKKLILEGPQIFLMKNREGASNFDDLIKSKGGRIILPAAFDQMQIRNGQIVYQDDKGKKAVALTQFEQDAKLSLDDKMENAQISGEITVEQIVLSLPGYKGTLPPLTLHMEHDINLNTPEDLVDVKSLSIEIANIRMEVKGKVEKVSKTPVLDLTVESGKIPLEEVWASLPKEESSTLSQLKAKGNLSIVASLKGETKAELSPAVDGRITLQDVRVDFSSVPEPFEMPYGEVIFNNRGLSFFSSQAKFAEAPMELKMVVEDFSNPSLTSELRTKLNLALLREFVSLSENTSLKGSAEINAKAYGKVKQLQAMNFSGRVDLRKVEVTTPTLGVPVRNLDAVIMIKGGDVDVSDLSLSLGKSSASLKGKVYGAIPYVLSQKQGKPVFSFNLDSPLLDLDEILPPSKEGSPKGTTAKPDTIPLPFMNAAGQIFLKRVIFRGIEFADVSSKVDVNDGVLRLGNIIAKVYSGSAGGEVTCDLRDMEQTEFNMNLTASQMEANDFLSRFTAFDDHLFGKLNLNASFSGKGNKIERIRNSLKANGTATFENGKLVNWELLDKLAAMLKIDSFREQDIRTLRNSFRIQDGRVWFDDCAASSKQGDFDLKGSLGLDGSLDYQLTTVLSPELSTRFDALGDVSDYFKNEQGRVVLDIRITGPAKNPEFALDYSKAEQRLKDRLKAQAQEKREEIKDQLKEKAEGLLEGLLKKKKK